VRVLGGKTLENMFALCKTSFIQKTIATFTKIKNKIGEN
jgi:hypothetical protein